MEILSVIYKIRNKINNKIYVGSAINFKNRVKVHKHRLRNNIHHSPRLQNSWNKHGGENFLFEVLEICEKDNLINREQYYIDLLNPWFNICKIAGSSLGVKHTDEAKLNMSKAQIGKTMSDDAKKKISESHKGMKHSQQTKENIRNVNLGKKQLKETIEKRVQKNTGRKNTEKTKLKMSKTHTGKKMSKESVEKTRLANIGRIPWNKGKPMSVEQKNKIRETIKLKKNDSVTNITN